ncbi:hypothetical protein [Streptomyces sp. NPDC007984]|uniref:hypothetical protein n=1 Tax=Streptomyces sp. NPDC007984 TaxID=3364801 RepID=UPI0036E7333A
MSISTESPPQVITEPWWPAYGRFADHCIQCSTCKAVDGQGMNLRLPCAKHDQLHGEYRQARKESRT